MGLLPVTPEEIEDYRRHCEERDRAIARHVGNLAILGVHPIPKEKYQQYWIRDGMRLCRACGTVIHNHPLGAIQIGDDWFDWLEIFEAVFRKVDSSNA